MNRKSTNASRALAPLLCFVALLTGPLRAGEVRVAVASNFTGTLKDLAARFEKATSHHVTMSGASSGTLYAQIKNGGPFDVFLSADADRPKLLEDEGVAAKGSRFTYAIGKLVLWSTDKALVDANGKVLASEKFNHLAIANPATAPYGLAAKQTLEKLKLWDKVSPKLVKGENIAQTLQFVQSSAAELGFIALSQSLEIGAAEKGSVWMVPQDLHSPINQDAVLLAKSKENAAAVAFMEFLKSPEARKVIEAAGYALP